MFLTSPEFRPGIGRGLMPFLVFETLVSRLRPMKRQSLMAQLATGVSGEDADGAILKGLEFADM
jgi:hypothetical protein